METEHHETNKKNLPRPVRTAGIFETFSSKIILHDTLIQEIGDLKYDALANFIKTIAKNTQNETHKKEIEKA